MNPITCKEYGELSIREQNLKESEIRQIELQVEAAAKQLRANQRDILFRTHRSLKAGSYVGVIAIQNRIIEILPKIDGEDQEVRFALVRMLAVAEDLRISDQELAALATQPFELLEILIRLFVNRLHVAMRKGIPRRYERYEEDLKVVRGRLDATRQFTRFAGRTDQLACIWDELTENTPLNRVLKAAVQLLLSLSKSIDNRRLLVAALERYDYVDDTKNPLLERVFLDRINSEFHNLYRFAVFFLSRRFQSTTTGEGFGVSMLFPMNELFEKFIGKSLKRVLESQGLSVHLQHQKHYAIRTASGERLFQLKPDVVIESHKYSGCIVLDTKWKSLKKSDDKRGVQQSDIYQMLTYGRSYNASRIVLLYPWHQGLDREQGIDCHWKAVSDEELPLDIATIDVRKSRTSEEIELNLSRLFDFELRQCSSRQ